MQMELMHTSCHVSAHFVDQICRATLVHQYPCAAQNAFAFKFRSIFSLSGQLSIFSLWLVYLLNTEKKKILVIKVI